MYFIVDLHFHSNSERRQEESRNFHWIIHSKQKISRQIYHYGDCVAEKIAQTANRKHNECTKKFENEIEIWLVRIICKGLFIVNTCTLHTACTHTYTAHIHRGKPMTKPDDKKKERNQRRETIENDQRANSRQNFPNQKRLQTDEKQPRKMEANKKHGYRLPKLD